MILRELSNGVVVASSVLLEELSGIVQAFSTRFGGVSKPSAYSSLNLSWKWNASLAAVEENHQRLCDALSIDRTSLVSPQQVHGSHVVRVDEGDRGRVIAECDGLVTQSPGVTLLLRFADCVPILLYDDRRRAVGLVHAGWRGTVGGIASQAIKTMEREFGSDPSDIAAVVGPSIGPCCYEVGGDVIDAAHRSFGSDSLLLSLGPGDGEPQSPEADRCARTDGCPPSPQHSHKMHFDLWTANEQLLREAGVARIDVSRLCTSCLSDTFYSYRAGRGRTGAHGALICLVE